MRRREKKGFRFPPPKFFFPTVFILNKENLVDGGENVEKNEKRTNSFAVSTLIFILDFFFGIHIKFHKCLKSKLHIVQTSYVNKMTERSKE
jgi:hypothetical protein